MDTDEFNSVLTLQLQRCRDILGEKADEYATDDRLHNFKVAAELQGVSPLKALGGMMAKHTVSVYDLIDNPEEASSRMWDEKITDHINYLILLRAIVQEELGRKTTQGPQAH